MTYRNMAVVCGEENGKADKRCHHYGHCENDKQKSDRKKSYRTEVISDKNIRGAVSAQIDKLVDLVFMESGIPHLIEFSRSTCGNGCLRFSR